MRLLALYYGRLRQDWECRGQYPKYEQQYFIKYKGVTYSGPFKWIKDITK